MAITFQEVDVKNLPLIKRFILRHEADLVPLAEEVRRIEKTGVQRARLCVMAFSDRKVVAVIHISDTYMLLPYWEADSGALVLQAIKLNNAIMMHLATVYAISGPSEMVASISNLIIEHNPRIKRRECIEYVFMTLIKKEVSAVTNSYNTRRKRRDIHVQQATIRDTPRILQLQVDYLKEEVQPEGAEAPNCHHALQHLGDSLKRHTYYVAWRGKQVIAKANSNAEGYACAQLGGIFTQKDYRNQGIGYRCITQLCHALFARYTWLVLFVKVKNTAAISLYRRVGFRPRGAYTIHYLL